MCNMYTKILYFNLFKQDRLGGMRDVQLPLDQNFFIFMQFSGKIGQKVCCAPSGWYPLWKILDLPLVMV